MSTGSATVLPAQYRMRRSTDFGVTVKYGRRATQPDIVIHARQPDASSDGDGVPADVKVGLIIAKSVGSAVQRHAVARRLRHVTADLLGELQPGEQLVIRARPGSSLADSATLKEQLRTGLAIVHRTAGSRR